MTATERRPPLDILRCYAGDESYALEMSWVGSVGRADGLRLQAGEDGSVGFVADEEGTIPVFSLASQLGRRSRSDAAHGHVIVLGGEPAPRALYVDRIARVLQLPWSMLMPLPALVADHTPPFFRGVLKLGNELVLLLAAEHLIPGFTPKRRGDVPEAPHLASWRPPPHPHRYMAGRAERGGQIVIFSAVEPRPRKRAVSFGLSITQVLEILDPPPLVPVPQSPASILGLVEWQDRPIPVIDLASRMGLAPMTAEGRARLMIARASLQADPVGFLVRPTIRIRRLPLPHLPCKQAPPVDLSLTKGAIELKNETLLIPDLAGITGF